MRTAVLWGVWPPDERGPLGMARNTQRALDGLIAECAGDAGCNAAFPKLGDDVAAVLRQAGTAPVKVAMTDGETGKPVEVQLTRTGLAQTLRYMLYAPSSAALLPLEVHLAAQGNWKPLVETARFHAGNLNSAAMGYNLALTCSEDVPFIREDEIPAAVQGTFLLVGTYRDKESGYEMRIERMGPHLRSVAEGQRPVVLMATSPTRFRIEGLPGYFFDFQVTEGKATACTLVEPGAPPYTLAREGP